MTKKAAPKKVYTRRLTILRALRDAQQRRSKDDIPPGAKTTGGALLRRLAKRLSCVKKRSKTFSWLEQESISKSFGKVERENGT
jgi:hypothetical protein